MPGVTYALADFATGRPIATLPVLGGAAWAAQLNRPDALSCTIDMRDRETRKLDLGSSTEGRKSVLAALNDDDVVLAWGLVDNERVWDEDAQTLSVSATGVLGSWLGASIIGPASALTDELVTDGVPNAALDTTFSGFSLGTIGKKLVEQRLTWPGAPTNWILQADEVLPADDDHTRTYLFPALKRIGPAINDLTNVENGPDFAFDAQRGPDGLSLLCVMRHGTEYAPRIGVDVGVWSLGGNTPITGLKVGDSVKDLGTAAWLSGGKTAGSVMLARTLNPELIASGYAPFDFVDTARNDVTLQATLDAYGRAAAAYASRAVRSLSFTVQADARPTLGDYRPGDRVTLGVPADHPYLTADIHVRITSMGGDETGREVTIGCEVVA